MKEMLLSLTVILGILNVIHAEDSTIIKKQFIEYYAQQKRDDSAVNRLLAQQQVDGSWPDVDYTSQRRGAWPTSDHLKNLLSLSIAYVQPHSKFYKKKELKNAIILGHKHWFKNDYTCPNWWEQKIGIPETMAPSLLLLGEDLPEEILKSAQEIIFKRTKMGMSGSNRVNLAYIAFMKGLLADDQALMKKASEVFLEEIIVTTYEGVQPDWTYHQHGAQQQMGVYGLGYGEKMVNWASITRNTKYALTEKKLAILRNYMLNGASWFVWNKRMDLSGCGRQVDLNCQLEKGQEIHRQLAYMSIADGKYKADYQLRLDNKLFGFKPFWRSEMAIQRRPGWYGSVKMSSKRVRGTECTNRENMQGKYLGDGVCFVYLTGDEYENVQPLWDWRRLPGTTCDLGLKNLTPNGRNSSEYSGVVGDSNTGVAAMIYERDNLVAHKAWFFGLDTITCLGAGIKGQTKGNVVTSIQQSLLQGKVTGSEGVIDKETKEVKAGGWIHHAGISYHLLTNAIVNITDVKGNWIKSFPTRGDRPARGDVFSLWIDHGKSPSNQNYGYVIYPNKDLVDIERKTFKPEIISNNTTVQAIKCDGVIQAVFYTAGEMKVDGMTIKVNAGCMLMIGEKSLLISDPTHKLESLTVSINGKATVITMPFGGSAGKTVEEKRARKRDIHSY